MSFANYKKNKTDVSNLTNKVKELEDGGRKSFKDDRFWRATVAKDGNGSARLRFLPAADGEDLPWIQYHEHNFEIDGNYFIELCPTTNGGECPVCKSNTVHWKTETEENQKIARNRKRQLRYVANILVLKDKDAPENEGKVFLYQFGQKIFEKIKLQLKPKDEGDSPVNVFDFWEGADFGLEIKQVSGYRNYDDSAFKAPAALFKGDESAMEKVYEKLFPLQPFVAPEKFKAFDVLEKKFNDTVSGVKTNVKKKADELFGKDTPAAAAPAAPKSKVTKKEDADEAPWEDTAKTAGKPAKKAAEVKAAPKKAKKEVAESEENVETESDDALNYYEELGDKD